MQASKTQRAPAGFLAGMLPDSWRRRSLRALSPLERQQLMEAQTRATQPIIGGVVFAGAMVLAMTGLFEVAGLAPGIGYPLWLTLLMAAAVASCAYAIRRMDSWRARLALTLLGTLLLGIFLSVPLPGNTSQLAIRTGLFQLVPIALLALLAQRPSGLLMVALMVALAALRIELHGSPSSGAAMYWLFTATTVGFGLMLGGYRMDFAIAALLMRNRLRQQAVTDGLTGLINREGWNREAIAAYTVAQEPAQPLSLAFFDIDHFKSVNDNHGHEAGDRVLQTMGRILRDSLGERDISARLGGEEFVVLFAQRPPAEVEALVQRMRRQFEQEVAAFNVTVTVSAGVAHRQSGETMALHLRRTDVALYEAKRAGRDRLAVSNGASFEVAGQGQSAAPAATATGRG